MSTIKDILNKNANVILYVVFFATFLIRLQELSVFKDFNSDKARQLHSAYEYKQGHGVSYLSYDLNTFKPAIKPNIDWPPMYSWMVAVTSTVTSLDMYNASVVIDYINLLILWITLFWLCSLIGLSKIQQVLFFIFLSCSKIPLQEFWSADLIGTTLFLISCGLNMSMVKKIDSGHKTNVLFFLLQLVIIVFIMMLKYSLLPAVATIVASLMFYYYNQKKKAYLYSSGLLAAIAVIAIAILVLYNQSISGQSTGMAERHAPGDTGLHFGNLHYFSPFLFSSLYYLGPFSNRFDSGLVNNISLAITLFLMLYIIITVSKNILTGKAGYFEYLFLITLLFVTGFLVLLSIKFKKDPQGIYFWTYVKEYRYFAPAIFLFLLYAFKNVSIFSSNVKKSILGYIVLPAVFLAVGLKVYYTYIGNKATSFEAMYGKIFNVGEDVKKLADEDTYFMSYTGNVVFDSQLTSLVAFRGTKVAMSYYGYFPDSTFKTPFTNKLIQPGKQVIIYLDGNTAMVDSVKAINKHSIATTEDGEQFLVIKN